MKIQSAWLYKYYVLSFVGLIVLFIGLLVDYHIANTSLYLPVHVWSSSSGIVAENSSIQLSNNEEIVVLFESNNEQFILKLKRQKNTENTSWVSTLVTSGIPLTYSLSRDNDNVFLIHVGASINHLSKMNENDLHELTQDIIVMPGTIFSREISSNQLALNKDAVYGAIMNICTILINVSGDVCDIQFNPILSDIKNTSIFFDVDQSATDGNRQNLTIAKNMTGKGKIWEVDFLGIVKKDVIGLHPSVNNETVVFLGISKDTVLPGKKIIKVPKELGFDESYIGIISVDDLGSIRWYCLTGPFMIGRVSLGSVASYVNGKGEIFLSATYVFEVEYRKNNARKIALNDRYQGIYNTYHGFNHSQALLIVDKNGDLLFSEKLADGYLIPPLFMHDMLDSALGLYARVAPRARLLNKNSIYVISDSYPLPPQHIFLEINADVWQN